MDFVPTMLELVGAEKSASRTAADGVSFALLLRGETATPHQELFWHYPHYWHGGVVTPYSVARVGDWKLIRFCELDREELYNLRDDLSQKYDLAASNPAKVKELHAKLLAWRKEVGALMPTPNPDFDPAGPKPKAKKKKK